MSTEQPAAVFYADVVDGKSEQAYIKVPAKRKNAFPAGTTVRVEAVGVEADAREQAQIAKEAIEFMKKGHNCGKRTYTHRSELHERNGSEGAG